jgi:hypothetical protein
VRVNISDNDFNGQYPNFAIESSNTICKQLKIIPPSRADSGPDSACGYGPEILGTTSAALPPPAPPSSDPNGDALVGGVCQLEGTCSSSGVNSSYWYFDIYLQNISDNPNSIVAGCDWNWGDSTAIDHYACYKGDKIGHNFNNFPHPMTTKPDGQYCRTYTVTLTMHFNNGAPDKSYLFSAYRPYGNTC